MLLQVEGLKVEVVGDKVFVQTEKEVLLNGQKVIPFDILKEKSLAFHKDFNKSIISFIKETFKDGFYDEALKRTFFELEYKDYRMQILVPDNPEENDIIVDFTGLVNPNVFKTRYNKPSLTEIINEDLLKLLDFIQKNGYENEWDNETNETCYVSARPWNSDFNNKDFKVDFIDIILEEINVYQVKAKAYLERV